MKKTFGIHLRAHRLGFRELAPFGYVRLMTNGTYWTVDVCPLNVLPCCSPGQHVVWWEDKESVKLVTIALERALVKGKLPSVLSGYGKVLTLELDDDGNLVESKKEN